MSMTRLLNFIGSFLCDIGQVLTRERIVLFKEKYWMDMGGNRWWKCSECEKGDNHE